jgi:hypothetical protein
MTPHFHFAVNRLGTGQRWNWIFGFCLCRYARVTLGCGFSAEVKLPYSKRRCEHGERLY